jgi:peptidyl-prolyl cis-trans isomerase SurA
MKLQLVKILVLILAFSIQLFAVAQEKDDRVLLSIGDEDVTVSEFLNIYKKNNVDTELSDKKSLEEYLQLYINFRLKVKQARDLGMDTAKAFIEELSGYREQLAEPYFNDQEVTDELLHEAYERLQYDVRASHILIRVDQNALPADTLRAYNEIMEVRERILSGEDFASVAAEISEDPSARDRAAQGQAPARKGNGGDLGYFTVFDMVYPFETGAYTTPVGEISMPVRTAYGYHLIYVTDKRDALGQATVAHLYIALPKNATAVDSARKKEEIFDLYERIQNGENFEDLVKEYSDDRGSKDKGGMLPRFGSNRMVPEFIVAVESIKDSAGISEPVLTSFGWHILKLIDRERPGDYKVEVLDLKRRMTKDVRANKSRESVIKRVKAENGFKEYPENLDALLKAIDSSYLEAEWSAEKVADMNKKIFQLGKDKYSQHDFGVHLESVQKLRGTGAMETFFYKQYHEYVNEKCIALKDTQLEDQYPEFKMLMNEYRDGILLFNLTDERIWTKAVQDTTGLKAYYQENKEKYMWDERLEADIFIMNDPSMEKEIRKRISWALAKNQTYAEQGLDTISGLFISSGFFSKGENSFIDQLDWTKMDQTFAQKLTEFNDLYDGKKYNENSLIFAVIKNVREPEPKALDEARGLVTSDYQNYLEKEWVAELKETYPVNINEEVLEDIQ